MIFHCLLLSLALCRMIQQDRPVVALTATDAAVASWDYTQTRFGIESGGIEKDPLIRPFAHNTAAMVAAATVEVMTVGYMAQRMKHSDHALLRKTWWIPQVVGIGAHIGCAIYSRGSHLPNPSTAVTDPIAPARLKITKEMFTAGGS